MTERVPYIPISYVPQTTFTTYVTGFQYLLKHHTTSYDAFAHELGIVKATAENVVRDLVMIGHAAANRRTETMKLETETDEEASRVLLNLCMTHVLYRELLKEKGDGGLFLEEEMTVIARRVLRLPSGSDFLVEEYRRRLQRWFLSVGLISTENGRIKLQARISHAGLLQSAPVAKRRSVQGEFRGEAPPHKALDALHSVLASPMSREELEQNYGCNTISVLIGLGIVNSLGVLCDSKVLLEDAESHLRNIAKTQPTILFLMDAFANNPALKPERIANQ